MRAIDVNCSSSDLSKLAPKPTSVASAKNKAIITTMKQHDDERSVAPVVRITAGGLSADAFNGH